MDYEKVLNIGTDKESANLNHNEIPLQTEAPKFKKTDNGIRWWESRTIRTIVWQHPLKPEARIPYDLVILLSGIYTREISGYVHQKTCS